MRREPFGNWFQSYAMIAPPDYPVRALNAFHESIRLQTAQEIAGVMRREGSMKVNFTYYIKLDREENGQMETIDHYFIEKIPCLSWMRTFQA